MAMAAGFIWLLLMDVVVVPRSDSESEESLPLLGPTFLLQTGQTFLFFVSHGSMHFIW